MSYQIIRGAPFEVFLSADQRSVDYLQQADLHAGDSVIYALGQLCVFVGNNIIKHFDGEIGLLATSLDTGLIRRIAIANPETAPYGVAARQLLTTQGYWQIVAADLVLGENAAQAAQFALSGAVDLALLPCSMSQSEQFMAKGLSQPIDSALYSPLKQSMLLLKGASESARRFFQFMQTKLVKDILLKNGYLLP
jgi:molybdate transport system substrate-binding protein